MKALRTPRHYLLAVPAFLLLAIQPGTAQTVNVSECRAIEDEQERFSCYESLGREGDDNKAARSEETVGIERFGRPGNKYYRISENDDGKAELEDTVAELREVEPNHWLITLDSGQQWRQVVGKFYHLREGEKVRIYPTTWGDNYRLTSTRLSSFIQVRRID